MGFENCEVGFEKNELGNGISTPFQDPQIKTAMMTKARLYII